MSDETIRVGDLVCVVKPTPCCGGTGMIGGVRTVSNIFLADGACSFCGDETEILCAFFDDEENGEPIETLKKIHPDAIAQSADRVREEELT